MSTTSPEGIKAPTLHAEAPEKGIGTVLEQQPGASSSPIQSVFVFPPYSEQELLKARTFKIWAWLLSIICLGCLGSLSLVPYILPELAHPTAPTQARQIRVRPTTTTIVSTPATTTTGNTTTGPFMESECTATQQNMKYLPTSGGTNNPTLPMSWLLAKRSQKDFANAQACAASFIIAYETFDSGNVQTFETSTSMLTDGAKQRFYGNAPNTPADPHMDPMWRAHLQKQQVQQKAQVGEPGLLESQYTNGKLLVWMVVPCQVTILIAGNEPIVENVQFTVLLVGVPVNTQGTGTGWQVSQWQEGSAPFAPPALL
jgi:hypothetical protein